ncbi:tRNA (guanine(46)-N(7))-methyltransferase TrmB [Glaciecola sp. 2405UD65-10]|uniref:tRNA (guanine(46)-N(7))-methyltransferase TrmB n=1 Tax=Glaciecola sp. 2405UD65-10 TaxID=3397244 RepID=UPI003B5BE24C
MNNQARAISSNQEGVHEDLLKQVAKHKNSTFKRPIADHTLAAFEQVLTYLSGWEGDVILDACCGVGESTIKIAAQYPNAKVIGIDKSIARLDKHNSYKTHEASTNYLLMQADLNDFWRLLCAHIENNSPAWVLVKQYILYPNPYPKKSQLSKRWHASAIFPFVVDACKNIEVRSNWRIYLEEFYQASQQYNLSGEISVLKGEAMTPFERKYSDAGQSCFQLSLSESK